ncbi:MAG: signal peptidase I [Defluviitaleaceae bacterium]|nr:signal peptidase I [Defluviitaleaceae bacterium]
MLTKKILRETSVWAFWAAFGIALSLLLNSHVLVNAHVLTGSMEGTIMAQNRVFGLRTSYIFSQPSRGDIIVFHSPLPDEFPQPFIKRIIALPGEEIAITGGIVHIDGTPLTESYVQTTARRDFAPTTIPCGHVFVMGDNRNRSRDSREWGTICKTDIIGRIYVEFSPIPSIISNYVYANQ